MRQTQRIVLLLLLQAVTTVILFSSGCSSVMTTERRVVTVTNSYPYAVKATNESGQVALTVGVSNVVFPQVFDVPILTPETERFVGTVREVNNAVPTPIQPLVNAGLTIFGAAAGIYSYLARRRVRSAEDMVDSVIIGVEAGRTEEIKDQLSEAISKAALVRGVSGPLHKRVKQITNPDGRK